MVALRLVVTEVNRDGIRFLDWHPVLDSGA